MVAQGALGKYTPGKPSPTQFSALLASFILYSLVAGYSAGIQPTGQWRFFSWHPFLMTCGMVGTAGIGAITKKLGGYTNTKLHALLGWSAVLMSMCGLYVIYKNKENNGFGHMKSSHAWAGVFVMVNMFGLGMAGSVFLHPDFGMDKTNKTIRFAHKTASRLTLMMAWATAFMGLFQLNPGTGVLVMYGVPLLALIPFSLM